MKYAKPVNIMNQRLIKAKNILFTYISAIGKFKKLIVSYFDFHRTVLYDRAIQYYMKKVFFKKRKNLFVFINNEF